jgi:hypothetical protein
MAVSKTITPAFFSFVVQAWAISGDATCCNASFPANGWVWTLRERWLLAQRAARRQNSDKTLRNDIGISMTYEFMVLF